LDANHINAEGAMSIAVALGNNATLTSLYLSYNIMPSAPMSLWQSISVVSVALLPRATAIDTAPSEKISLPSQLTRLLAAPAPVGGGR
jgi:hypothetical protein